MARQSQPLFSVDEYLAIERASEDRHEYLDGSIFAMAGESGEHGDISANLTIQHIQRSAPRSGARKVAGGKREARNPR